MLVHKKVTMKILWFLLVTLFIFALSYSTSSSCFSTHPSTTSINRIPDKIQAFIGESLLLTTTFTNNESLSLRGFYYVDQIPQGLTVNTISVKVNGNNVSNYIPEIGSAGDIYTGTIPYRWILEAPAAFDENNPIGPGSVLKIVYSITSDKIGTFQLDEFHCVGYYQGAIEGERAAFMYNEDTENISVSWLEKPVTLISLSINGPNSVDENNTANYTATATLSTNETQLVTNNAIWSVIPSLYASISSPGELNTLEVPSDQTVTITAEYTLGDVTATDTTTLTIVDINTDSDSDGMPDQWENDYGLDPNIPLDALEDHDSDGYTNLEEFIGETSPQDNSTHPIRPYIIENDCHPYNGQGIEEDSIRVPIDTSIVIRIKDDAGIDTNSIVMTVQGEDVSAHLRLRQIIEGDSTDYWVIHSPLTPFNFEEIVTVTLESEDIDGIAMNDYTCSFQVESENEYNVAKANTPPYTVDDYSDPNHYMCLADPGTEIEGAGIVYDPNEPFAPRFGPLGEIPELTVGNGVGYPVALEPFIVFQKPITIFIPCPGIDDVSALDVFYFNPAVGWVKAEETDGWMVPGTRVNHNETSPPTIEIQVKYLRAVQAGLSSSSNSSFKDREGSTGGCFISTTDHTSAI